MTPHDAPPPAHPAHPAPLPPLAPRTPASPGGPVGLVGLGLMGSAIAQRLLQAGFTVVGHDRRPKALADAVALGVEPAPDAAAVAARCPQLIFSLYDSASVREVLAAMENTLRSGHLILDTTTGDLPEIEAIARALAARGITYLDAPISGHRDQLLAGDAVVLVGGPHDALAAAQPLLTALSPKVRHVGPAGAGAKLKLITNLVLGLNRAALAEGLAFAQALGVPPAEALPVLAESPAYSRAMDVKGRKMIAADFAPQARLSQHLKDVRLMLAAATAAGRALPLTETHRSLLEQAEQLGLGELDNSAIVRVLQASRLPAATPSAPPA